MMKNITKQVFVLDYNGFSAPLSESYLNKCLYTSILFKNLYIGLFGNSQGIKPMGLSASLFDYKNK